MQLKNQNDQTDVHELVGKAMYAQVHKANPYGKFQVDLILEDDDMKTKAENIGLTLKTDKYDNQTYVTITRKETNSKGERIFNIPVTDFNGSPITANIGNGSKVVVQFGAFPYDNKWGKGIAARMFEMKVLDLVPYKG